MNNPISITIDGQKIPCEAGQTILAAAEHQGIYIPRLCAHPELTPFGSCRLCTVKANGRMQAACIQPVAPGMIVENDTAELNEYRKMLLEMLFVEGNHYCPFCEKSGTCELQALAYRFGLGAPRFPFIFPKREVDASHPDVWLDRDRCVLCGRCVRSSHELDNKQVVGFVNRSHEKRIEANAADGLKGTLICGDDQAVKNCPVGALLAKRQAYKVPVGQRQYDRARIGSEVDDAQIDAQTDDQ